MSNNFDAAITKMQAYVDTANKKIMTKEKENELIRAKAVELIKAGQKDKACKLVGRRQKNDKFVGVLLKRITYMEKNLITMEEMKHNYEVAQIAKETNDYLNKQRNKMDGLQDELLDAKEAKLESDLNAQQLDSMFENLDEDLDDDDDLKDMMAEYEAQVDQDMKDTFDKADSKLITKPKNVPAQQKDVQQPKQDDKFDQMMAELMN